MSIRIQAWSPAGGPEGAASEDLHTPFVHCVERTRAGEPFPVAVRVGHESEHPDEPEHHIAWLQLWTGDRLLAEARFAPGLLGGAGATGNAMATFSVVPTVGALELTALAYCTRHGLWTGPARRVEVEPPADDEDEGED